ncbi:siroheme synthase [Planctomycetales bacterium ZRK34]|nr:siroheme synthase [Planctomycetales bacterium ZRK34]
MADLPAVLKIRGRRAVVVGGGGVARRRAAALAAAGAKVEVIAPEVDSVIEQLGVMTHRRGYETGDLAGAAVVVVATCDAAVNEQVTRDAAEAGVMVNRADEPEGGDFIVPAHAHVGPITIAVSTSGISAKAAAVIRDQLIAAMDKDWVKLLETVQPFRAEAQEKITDADKRTAALHRLTDAEAMQVLKQEGAAALADHCRRVVDES